MKKLLISSCFLLIGFTVSSQILDNNTPEFEISGVNDGSESSFGFERKAPSFLSDDKDDFGLDKPKGTLTLQGEKKKPLDITTDNNEFIDQTSNDFKPKAFKDPDVTEDFSKDQYLGDYTTRGKFVTVYCRDHQFVDGDRIRLMVNNSILKSNVILTGRDRAFLIDLKPGLNQIDFVALNQGTSGPNTAQLKVYDEDGKLLSSNVWNLATGNKGTLIVLKE